MLERLKEAVNADAWLVHRGRFVDTRFMLESGATQHLVGCKGSKHILAINTDPDAPIVAAADYAIIGDLHVVLPALSAAVRKKRSGG
mgnify:CR=1 FL=1